MKPSRLVFTGLLSSLLSLSLLACSSSSNSPKTGSNTQDSGPAVKSVGDWSCYPDVGTYLVHYTLKSGDASKCKVPADIDTPILEWKGRTPTYDGCTVSTDEAKCTLTNVCELEDKTVTTDLIYSKGKVPPASGTVKESYKKVAPITITSDSGTSSGGGPAPADAGAGGRDPYECVFSFTYTKK